MTRNNTTFIEFNGNAFIYDWARIADNCCGLHLPEVSIDDFRKYYKKAINAARKKGQEPIIVGLPAIDTKKYFQYVSKNKNQENILSWLGGSCVYIADIYETYREELKIIAQEEGISLLEIAPQMKKEHDYSHLLCEDGIHLNRHGRDFVENIIAKTFN